MKFATVLLSALSLAPPAAAQGIRVINQAGVKLPKLEAAVAYELNHYVQPHWRTPHIWFGRRGSWTVYVRRQLSGLASGLHVDDPGTSGVPGSGVRALVLIGRGWRRAFAHEAIEMTVDPHVNRYIGGHLAEVCDPVNWVNMKLRGVSVSDFVFPRWYRTGTPGPWDALRVVPGPLRNA